MPAQSPLIVPAVTYHLRIAPAAWSDAAWPAGVMALSLTKHRDDRGFFMEIVRLASLRSYGFTAQQVSVSATAAGIVKAFHFHQHQSDLFCPISGAFRIVLIDARAGPTFGHGYSAYTDVERPMALHIPAGVAHGYQVLGKEPGLMLYVTNREYDPSDEHRAAWNDARIGFPWDPP